MRTIYVGGCFNDLHRGHMALLERCVEIQAAQARMTSNPSAIDIVVGLMSDEYLHRKYPRAHEGWFEPYGSREEEIEHYINSRGGWCTIREVDDPETVPSDGILVVSEETAWNACRLIARTGSTALLSVVPTVKREDGRKVSSSDSLPPEERYDSFLEELVEESETTWSDEDAGYFTYKGETYIVEYSDPKSAPEIYTRDERGVRTWYDPDTGSIIRVVGSDGTYIAHTNDRRLQI